MDNLVVVISGPSGSGKSTVIQEILSKKKNTAQISTYTTREPRVGEIDGRQYNFISPKEYLKLLNEKKLMVIDNLKLDNFKTKTGVELLNNLKLDGKVLFVASEEAENLYMATRNLNNVLVLFPDEINVYDILNADYVVFDEASIKMVEEALK